MLATISFSTLQAFLNEQSFPDQEAWQATFYCLYIKQDCPHYSDDQHQDMRRLFKESMAAKEFSAPLLSEVRRQIDFIIQRPYLLELQNAIEETDALINKVSSSSGRQIKAVNRLEKLTLATIKSNKKPQVMVKELKGAFNSLIRLMEDDVKVLEQLSKTDPLTNIGNRRAFDEQLSFYCQEEWADQLFLMMIDIDHFKTFNDTYGHLVGDEVLALVATILDKASHENVRGHKDFVTCRYGGEEFAIIMPQANEQSCLELGEYIRSRIQRYPLVIRNSRGDIIKKDVHITVSIGFSQMHPSYLTDPANAASQLIKGADRALYACKKRGRNMVCQHKAYIGADGKLTSAIL